jgi:bifunctional UDP-N-acetylglucosamine pyrophosphorylase/glucosamine-1-phosphate N-acetyltransferase
MGESSEIEKNVSLNGQILIGENTRIRSGTYIEGPCIIGNNCDIGPNCYIRPYTTIGNNCRIGNGVEVKNSIIFDNSKIPHLSYVGDSIIGENCNLGAGTKVANLRHDKKTVCVLINEKLIDSNRRKLGVIMADYCKTGVNTSIKPGIVMGPFSWTLPNSYLDENLEPFRLFAITKKIQIEKNRILESTKDSERNDIERLYEDLNNQND